MLVPIIYPELKLHYWHPIIHPVLELLYWHAIIYPILGLQCYSPIHHAGTPLFTLWWDYHTPAPHNLPCVGTSICWSPLFTLSWNYITGTQSVILCWNYHTGIPLYTLYWDFNATAPSAMLALHYLSCIGTDIRHPIIYPVLVQPC